MNKYFLLKSWVLAVILFAGPLTIFAQDQIPTGVIRGKIIDRHKWLGKATDYRIDVYNIIATEHKVYRPEDYFSNRLFTSWASFPKNIRNARKI